MSPLKKFILISCGLLGLAGIIVMVVFYLLQQTYFAPNKASVQTTENPQRSVLSD